MHDSLDSSILIDDEILKIKKLIDNALKKAQISYEKLALEVKLKPDDKGLRFKLAESYLSSSETEKGFNELLKIFEQDPNWKENSAKKNF